MIFSVYDYASRAYDYYEAPGTSATYGLRGTKYRPLIQKPQGPLSGVGDTSIGPIGFAPEALALPLPRNAQRVGRGQEPRGVIAVNLPHPEYPARYEEHGGTISGLAGFGDVPVPEPASAPVADVKVEPVSFGHVVVAACVASVVGVIVQRLLSD